MREIQQAQTPLLPTVDSDFRPALELEEMSRILDAHPDISKLVHQDLVGDRNAATGRKGLTGDQVLRLALLKQLRGYSYGELPFQITDSLSARRFVRIGIADGVPSDTTIWENVAKVRPETWQAIFRRTAEIGVKLRVDDGSRVRGDCTVVEADIHYPTDSSLLSDFVRVVARALGRLRDEGLKFRFSNHSVQAKRRDIGIHWTTGKREAGTAAKRKALYKQALRVARKTAGYVENALVALDRCNEIWSKTVAAELRNLLELGRKVIDQTHRRVILNKKVPARQKIASIFEPHTDIICKDNQGPYFGHKVLLATGASGLLLDCEVLDGNPRDSSLVGSLIDRIINVTNRVPDELAFDGGFSSRRALGYAKSKGIATTSFSKHPGIQPEEMVPHELRSKAKLVLKAMRHFRAGIEATISFLKHSFGLVRCTWRGQARFHSYIHSTAAAFNLLIMARHLVPADP